MEIVALIKLLLPQLGLLNEALPVGLDLLVLGLDLRRVLRVDLAKARGLLTNCAHAILNNSC